MQEHCKALSDNKLRDAVAKEICKHSDSVEHRLKLWISMLSKKIVSFNAGWVALDCVCGEYIETQNEVAEKNIPSLTVKF